MKQVCILLVLLICWTINGFTEADSLSDYKIVKGNQVIKFVNKETKAVVKMYDVVAGNPFQNLSFPVKGRNEEDYNIYEITDQNRDAFLKEILPETTPQERKRFGDFTAALSYQRLYFPPKHITKEIKHFVVEYSLSITSYAEDFSILKSVALVFNAKGEIIFQLENKNMQIIEPLVTNDGKYYAFSYNKDMSLGRPAPEDVGLKVYDIAKKTVIVDRKVEEGYYNISGPVIYPNGMMFCKFINTDDYKLLFYDFSKKVIYTKVYPRSLFRQYFTEAQSNGYAFKEIDEKGRSGKILWIDTFENDFEKEDF